MRTYIFIYIFVFLSTVCLAQIDNNSTRSNSVGDLQLRRYSAGDTVWKRALVVGYDASNKDGLLYINYEGDFNLGTRISGPQLIIDGNLKFGSEYNQILFPEKLGYGGGITGDDGNYKRLTLFHGHSIALQTGSNNRNYLNTRLYINSLGNIGIGTSSPGAKLDVSGGDIRLATNATYLRSKDSASAQPRVLGMNSANTFYVGPIDSYAGGAIVYGASSNLTYHSFYGGGSEKVRITSAGNIVNLGKIKGSAFGMVVSGSFQYMITKRISIGVRVGILLGTLTKYKKTIPGLGTETVKLSDDEKESLGRLDISGGSRFYL